MKIEVAQVLTQIISFLVMLWILTRYAWKPIMAMLDERKAKIESDFKGIEEEKRRAAEMQQEYDAKLAALEMGAQERMQQAIDQGKAEARKILDEAHSNAKAMLVKAQEDMQNEIAQAHVQLKKELVESVLTATAKILPKNLDAQMQKELLEDINRYVGEAI